MYCLMSSRFWNWFWNCLRIGTQWWQSMMMCRRVSSCASHTSQVLSKESPVALQWNFPRRRRRKLVLCCRLVNKSCNYRILFSKYCFEIGDLDEEWWEKFDVNLVWPDDIGGSKRLSCHVACARQLHLHRCSDHIHSNRSPIDGTLRIWIFE